MRAGQKGGSGCLYRALSWRPDNQAARARRCAWAARPHPSHTGPVWRPSAGRGLAGWFAGRSPVIADAAYDADPLRAFIADDLGASAQIKANPSRSIAPSIDWRLYKERHQIECFFNKLKRFRRIALRCEKTIAAFMGFVHLACAMIWLR